MAFVENLKNVILITCISVAVPVYAGSINYGYNAHGDYVPTSIGGQQIQYGYNAHGDYVPQRINPY